MIRCNDIEQATPLSGPRICRKEDVVLSNGLVIPRDTMIWPMMYMIHRHPDNWPDADRSAPPPHVGQDGMGPCPVACKPQIHVHRYVNCFSLVSNDGQTTPMNPPTAQIHYNVKVRVVWRTQMP